MAENVGMKYSNTVYATKQDVINDRKVPFVDRIWGEIIQYRSNFQIILNLKHITSSNYSVCMSPIISERINALERKLIRSMINFNKLGPLGKKDFTSKASYNLLNSISKYYRLNVTSEEIFSIINNDGRLLGPDALILNRYNQTLKCILNSYSYEITDDFFGNIYSELCGTDDLVEFYRTNEINTSINRSQVNKTYLGIPTGQIEASMNSLIVFLRSSNVSPFVKAACALYYIYYVKPFESFSEEISVLLFKAILAHNDLEQVAVYLNAEELLTNKEELEDMILECQKTLDLTYIVNYILKKFEGEIDSFLDLIVKSNKHEIYKETYAEDSVKEVSEPEKEETPSEEQKVEEKVIIKEVVRENSLAYNQNIAFSTIPAGLSEQEAQKLEQMLLEMYPNLSRSQAYFYARHCTMGSKYTISQYKKEIGCVYETARTSMDNLVFLGLYRKEPLKNKYVYLPVKKN